jgi:hypothetical protein
LSAAYAALVVLLSPGNDPVARSDGLLAPALLERVLAAA